MTTLTLYNTLTRREEAFAPHDPAHVRLYVCGPTVYARPHIGNARSAVVYDVLYRLLCALYPRVTYVRNITDVDDKINTAAIERGISIHALTQEVTAQFHADMDALCVLRPTIEPRATDHIAEMIAMIETLIARGHAYAAEGHALFSVASDPHYGCLSRRPQEEMLAGARVEVAPYKKHPGDFVLWKPASKKDDPSSVFDSPWGKGRPGWHIECSAMSCTHLGVDFDIHGGGADLMFPHHENEIAQSMGAHPGSHYAKYWVHNGFLTVNGEKMSKSLGNFITVHDLLERGVNGEDIRLALLSSKYNEPLDWNDKLLHDAKLTLDKWYRKIPQARPETIRTDTDAMAEFMTACASDLNLPKAFSLMHAAAPETLYAMGRLLGFFAMSTEERFQGGAEDSDDIAALVAARAEAKKARDFAQADRIRDTLKARGILLEDRPDGTTDWRKA